MYKKIILLMLFNIFVFALPINYKLRNGTHPVTDVPFKRNGFAKFDPLYEYKLNQNLYKAGERIQFQKASFSLWKRIQNNPNLSAKFTKTQLEQIRRGSPKITGLTWHHDNRKGILQLVDADIHNKTAHSGGRSLWGGGKLGRQGKIPIASTSRALSIKATSKIATSAAMKAGAKGAAKGTAMSLASKMPIIGIASQIAMDAYIMYQIEYQGEDIKQNKQTIQANRNFIIRLENEQEILELGINKNNSNINKIINNLYQNNERLNQIDMQLISLSTQIVDINILLQDNQQEIKNIKNGAFFTAVKKMDEFYSSDNNKQRYIGDAILMFNFTNEIKHRKVLHLVDYYLVIARYEQYLLTKDIHDIDEIKKAYIGLINFTKDNNEYLTLVNNAYLSISDLSNEQLNPFKEQLDSITKLVIKQKINSRKFDDAEKIVFNYLNTIQEDANTNNLYMDVIKAKKSNFEKYKIFKYPSSAIETLETNQNSLLNEKAVRFLYKEKDLKDALFVLRNYRFEDEDFRLKAFLLIYEYQGKTSKFNKLVNLIKNNPTYSKKIKDFVNSKR